MQCSHCQHDHLVKCGFNRNLTQRFQCKACQRYTTFDRPERAGAAQRAARRELGLKMVYEGNGFRAVGRLLAVSPQSVINWVDAAHARLQLLEQQQQREQQDQALPRVALMEADEQWTFLVKKRSNLPALCHLPNERSDHRALGGVPAHH